MASIRLENISKVFEDTAEAKKRAQKRHAQGYRYLQDQAFAERARSQAGREHEQLTRHAGPVHALNGIDLVIPDGESLAIVGPSGCGKSTLLRVVAGLTEFSGAVYYDGKNMTDIPPKERYIGMVFQDYALYPHFSGKGNLGFFFKMHKAPTPEVEARIQTTSEIMGIGFNKLLGRKPGTLSGGEQQRVAIGRAIVRQPQLLLFDEPLSNLDAKLRARTRTEIKRLIQKFGITTLYVTHDQTEAIAIGDRIAVMREGRIEQLGDYRQLREDPDNTFIAGFIGQPPMNLLAGGIVRERALELDGATLPLPADIAAQVTPGQSLTVGIHAEEVLVPSAGKHHARDISLTTTIEIIEPDFSRDRQILYLRVGRNTLSAITDARHPASIGDTLEIVAPPTALYFFDGETEKRIR